MDDHTDSNASRLMQGRAIVVLIPLIGLVLGILFLVPLLLNTPKVRTALLHELEQQTGHRLAVEDLQLKLLPRPRLDLRQVKVFNRHSDLPLVSASRLDVALQIVPLLQGRAIAAHVVIESPRMTVRHLPSGEWTIGDEAPETEPEKKGRLLGILTVVRNFLIVDGTVTFVDQSRSVQSEPVQLASVQLTMAEEISGRTAKVKLSAEAPQGTGESALLNIEGSLVMLDGAGVDRSPDAVPAVQVDGTIRLHKVDVRHVAGWFGLPSAPGFIPPAQLVGHLRVVPRSSGYNLIVSDWRAGLSDLALQGAATFIGLGTEAPHVSVTLSASSVPLKQTLQQLPPEWLPGDLRDKLMEHALDGFISLHDTHVEGPLHGDARFSVAGVIEIRDGRYHPGGNHPAVRDVSATLLYDLEQVRVTGFRGHYGPVRLSDGTALITEWRREPTVDLRISGDVRAADLIALLNDEGRFPRMAASLAQLDQVTGEVGVVMHMAGMPAKGDLDVEDASVSIRNLGFRHRAVAVPFWQIQANVQISPTEIRLDSVDGHAGFARVEGGGKISLIGEPSFQDMVLTLTADGKDLASWLHDAASEEFRPKVEGHMLMSASLTGDVRMPRFQGRFTLDGAAVEVPHIFAKSKGAPAGIRFEGEVLENQVLSVRRCELIIPPVRLTGGGRIRMADDWDFRARIVSDALSLESLPRGVSLGPVKAGVLKGGLKMEGRAADRASWETSGRLSFSKGVIEEQFQSPIRNLAIKLRFNGKNIDIRRLTFTVDDSDIRLTGSIDDWLDAPRAKLVMESSQINVRSFRLNGQNGSSTSSSTRSFPVLRSWWANGFLEATLLIDYAYYERLLLTGLSCRVKFEQGLLTIDRISSDTEDGHLGGRFVLNMADRGTRSMKSSFHMSGLPVERLLSFMENRPRITGWMTTAGRIQAQLGNDRVFRSSINSRRPISVLIEDGRLFYAPVLSKILSLLNLPALLKGKTDLIEDGMPVDRLKLVFGVEDGVINVSELLLDSPILKISATGRYDFISDEHDLVVVTSPLGKYSDLLKSVPLFGKLFAGERQGFDTAIFEVKGPGGDPKVVYLPTESLMAGAKGTAKLAFDLLVNAITLPKEAYAMAEDLFADDEEEAGEDRRKDEQ